MISPKASRLPKPSSPVIHRAAWLVTGLTSRDRPKVPVIIRDGALVAAGNVIRVVGPYKAVAGEYPQYPTRDHEDKVLCPALINSHCHLELSHLVPASEGFGRENYGGDTTRWIRDLLAARERFSRAPGAEELILARAREALAALHDHGVGFVGDIGNAVRSRVIGRGRGTRVAFLLELLGLTQEAETKTLERLKNISLDKQSPVGCTAHAPYSTSPALIRAIKNEASRQGRIFSIHTAESIHEIELLRNGTGVFADFLKDRGIQDNSFAIPAAGAVEYLDTLDVLDEKTLCVHAVHVDRAEIGIMAARKAKVCLCPGSNRYLGVGKAPVAEFLAHGIITALGTDSRASNNKLNMWREMRLLREDHPELEPEAVFAMASRNGAEAWNVAAEIGTLGPGKQALALAIKGDNGIRSDRQVFEYLTTAGETVQAEWLR